MNVLISNTGVSWTHKNKVVSVQLQDIQSALAHEASNVAFALHAVPMGTELVSFSLDGNERFRVLPPPDGRFSYLTLHPKLGPLVVITYATQHNGWFDWHHTIGPNGELTKSSPAY
mgnify:FL=1